MGAGLNAVPLLLPLVVYLSLCQLPKGRGAAIGIGFAAVVAALAWVGGGAAMPPLVAVVVPALVAAAAVQAVRVFAGASMARGTYIALVGLPIVIGVALLFGKGA